jgi:hypothetical protein
MTTEVQHQGLADIGADRARLIEVERVQRLADAFHQEHPKVARARIQPVKEGEHYLITLDDVVWKMTLISPQKVAVAKVDPRDHAVLLEPPLPIRLLQAPEPPVPPDLVHQAYAFKGACQAALDRLRQDAANWHDIISPGTDPVPRLRSQYPGTIPTPQGPVFNDGGLAELGHGIARVAELLQTVPALAASARTLVADATAAIRTAIISVAPPSRPSIRTAGDPTRPMRTQVEVNLDALQDDPVDTLGRALDELAPTIQTLTDATPGYLEAALLVLREGVVARGVLFVERELARLRQGRDTGLAVEVAATRAVTRLFMALERPFRVPYVAWSLTEPWEVPRLT